MSDFYYELEELIARATMLNFEKEPWGAIKTEEENNGKNVPVVIKVDSERYYQNRHLNL